MCVSHISAAVANVPDIKGTSVLSAHSAVSPQLPNITAKKQKASLYLRLNLTISSTSQTYQLVQHQSKATLTRGNIVGKLHNSLCHTRDKKTQQTADLLENSSTGEGHDLFLLQTVCVQICPDLHANRASTGSVNPYMLRLDWKQVPFCTNKPTGKSFYINGRVTRENLTLDFGHTRGEDSSSSAHLTSKLHCAFSHRHVSRHNPLTLCTRNYLHMVSGAHSRLSLASFNKERIPEDSKHA